MNLIYVNTALLHQSTYSFFNNLSWNKEPISCRVCYLYPAFVRLHFRLLILRYRLTILPTHLNKLTIQTRHCCDLLVTFTN